MLGPLIVSIRWEILQVYLLILFAGSWIAMVGHSFKQLKSGEETLRDYLERYSIRDYIGITRRETGSIGTWFWVFVVSFVLLLSVSVQCVCGDYYATGVKYDGDYLWPIL
jgi:hypothetical protein